MSTGSIIKELRKKAKLTQEELAIKIGISKNGLWNYENDKRNISIDLLQKIADVLEVSINDLLGTKKSTHDDIDYFSKIFSKESIEEATSLLSKNQKIAFNNMYSKALENLGIIESLAFGDIPFIDLDYMYLSTSFTEIFRSFNNEIGYIIYSGKSEFTLKDMNSIVDATNKYSQELYSLLRKNIELLQIGVDFYIDNEKPYFEKEILEKFK